MKRTNLVLAGLAIFVLIVTLSFLQWQRQRFKQDMESAVNRAGQSFKARELLHGYGGVTLIHFAQVDRLVELAQISPYIRTQPVVTRLMPEGGEIPVSPFTMLATYGPNWPGKVQGWRKVPLGEPGAPFGFLYLDLDYSSLHSMTGAMVAIGLAIALTLFILLARVWSQESTVTRTTVELNERRRELIRLERLALGGQLASGILHDLRKPVLNIQHNAEELDEALGDFAHAAAPLQEINRQTRLFFQILSESQIERFVQSDRAAEEFVDLGPILDLSLNLVKYERRAVEVTRLMSEGMPPLLAHPFRLIQLFSNLILNAYQAMKGHGHLMIAASEDDQVLQVRITDNGPGMPPEILDHIFEPFYTTKPEGEGTGLGLSICRMIVEDLGGRIYADSAPGGPTVFTIRLPIGSD